MLASWGLLAFLKAADTRQGASFAVKADTDVVTDFAEDYYDENGRIETYDDYYPNSQDYQDDYSDTYYDDGKQYRDEEVTDFSQLEDRFR